MGKNFRWFTVTAVFQRGWPKQGMKIQDVFTDKMVQLSLGIFGPVFVKIQTGVGAELFKAGHVAYGRIQPHVKILTRRIRDFKTKIRRITRYIPIV